MPMMIVGFRFPGTAPAVTELRTRLLAEVGARKLRGVDVEVGAGFGLNQTAADVSALSMDIVSLVYTRKVLLSLGGLRIRLDGSLSSSDVVPPWASVPWSSHGLLTRMRIRMERISL